MLKQFRAALLLFTVFSAQAEIMPPSEMFGFTPGDDYKLASYEQMEAYYQYLADNSDRVQLRTIGESVLGRPLYLMTISTPENLANLDRYRDISAQMARARIDRETAEELASEGKAVIWIDAGLHATELAHGQMAPQLAYRLLTEESEELDHIRENVIILFMPMINPDGLEIVRKWYERTLGTPYESSEPPELYHHYVGHDNNRDFFMNNMPESRASANVLYNEWYPQVVLNHHQISPAWARIVIPPYSDPVNPLIHPGVTTALNEIGAAMGNRLSIEGISGAISDVGFSMWWNGGQRTVPYYHNMIGILTEVAHRSPSPAYYDPKLFPRMREVRDNSRAIGKKLDDELTGVPDATVLYPDPWPGGDSRFSEPVRIFIESSLAVLRNAADGRKRMLTNIYRMGRDSIEAGQTGTRFYVIPADQRHADEAHNLVNILRSGGVEIFRAEESMQVEGQRIAAGSFVIPTAQAFRPFVVDLLEKQKFPDTRLDPSGETRSPYDITGWTLPMQMGVEVIATTSDLDVTRRELTGDVSMPPGEIEGRSARYGYALPYEMNLAVKVANRLMAEGETVYWANEAFGPRDALGEGTFVIEASDTMNERAGIIASEYGVDLIRLSSAPSVELTPLSLPTVGLYKSYAASKDEGWTRFIMEEYGFAMTNLMDSDLRSGDLSDFDAIILPDPDARVWYRNSAAKLLNGHPAGTMPEEFTGGMGLEGALNIDRFVRGGGTLVTFGAASNFAIHHFNLPIRNIVSGAPRSTFSIPGSLIRAKLNRVSPLAYGMPEEFAVNFVNGGAYMPIGQKDCVGDYLNQGDCIEIRRGGRPLNGWPEPVGHVAPVVYADEDLLMSGWSKGEDYIASRTAVAEVAHGEGKVVLFGFRPQFRAQPRGTYKLVFNSLLEAASN